LIFVTTLCKAISAVVLVAVLSPLYGAALAAPTKPAGCHHREKQQQAPASSECCRAGHQLAAVREAATLRSPLVVHSRVIESVFALAALPSAGCSAESVSLHSACSLLRI
jgi:hypothetical protein